MLNEEFLELYFGLEVKWQPWSADVIVIVTDVSSYDLIELADLFPLWLIQK